MLKKNKYVMVLISLILIILWSMLLISKINSFNNIYNNKYYQGIKKYRFKIINLNKIKEESNIYIAEYMNSKEKRRDRFLIYIYDKQNILKYGDYIEVIGEINIPKNYNNEGQFNYKRYLNSNNTYGVVYSKEYKVVKVQKDNITFDFIVFFEKMRENIDQVLYKKIRTR